jgi:hypothetical protein
MIGTHAVLFDPIRQDRVLLFQRLAAAGSHRHAGAC